jgi:hypothetical protein
LRVFADLAVEKSGWEKTEMRVNLNWMSLQEDNLVAHFLRGFCFGYDFEPFDAFADCHFLLVDVDYAWVIFVNGYSNEVYVVGEDYGLVLDGCFQLFLVC